MKQTSGGRAGWASYLNRRMANRSQAEFAKLIHTTDGQLSKWRTESIGVSAETVISVARLLGDSPLHALVEAGFLQAAEVAQFRTPKAYGLDDYSDLELAREVVRRIETGEAGPELDEGGDEPTGGGTVTPFRRPDVPGGDQDLAEAAWESPIDHDGDHDDYHA